MFVNELPVIFQWWFLLFIIGITSFPLVILIFKKFFDAGYGLTKILGVALFSFIVFLLSIIHLLPLRTSIIYLILELYVAFNFYLFIKNKKEIIIVFKEKLKVIVFQELFFVFGLVLWSFVRGHAPDINSLEKFMDYGFINSILKSEFLPPADMWFTGKPINYYWFGHFWSALLTKITSIPPSITYNLLLATILGFSLNASFSVVSTLVDFLKERKGWKLAFSAGIISALLLNFAGNFHTPFYVLKEGVEKYWYPDATRFIGYNPDTNDKTIHEFPMYSYVVSDLHAHLLNYPFVLLFIALLANVTLFESEIIKPKSKFENLKIIGKFVNWKLFKDLRFLVRSFPYNSLFPLGFVLGLMFMTSTWDFGNYLLTTGVVFLLLNIYKFRFSLTTVLKTALMLFFVIFPAIITALPFILNFESIAQGIDLVNAHTPLWQLAILWGFPALLTVVFTTTLIGFGKLTRSDIFVIALLTASWLLIFLPEIIYVKDIYIASHHRANTMFKLTYQAFVMFYLTSGYITVRAFTVIKNRWFKLLSAFVFLAVFASILSYVYFSTNSYYGGLKTYKGLNGEKWLETYHPNEANAISWLRQLPGQPTILEAPGDSYTEFNVISSYTGFPTVSGWFVHEWLWRGTAEIPQQRVSDITLIYTSVDNVLTENLLDKYGVEYVIVGDNEREKFPDIYESKFSQLGQLVYTTGVVNIYKLNY